MAPRAPPKIVSPRNQSVFEGAPTKGREGRGACYSKQSNGAMDGNTQVRGDFMLNSHLQVANWKRARVQVKHIMIGEWKVSSSAERLNLQDPETTAAAQDSSYPAQLTKRVAQESCSIPCLCVADAADATKPTWLEFTTVVTSVSDIE